RAVVARIFVNVEVVIRLAGACVCPAHGNLNRSGWMRSCITGWQSHGQRVIIARLGLVTARSAVSVAFRSGIELDHRCLIGDVKRTGRISLGGGSVGDRSA